MDDYRLADNVVYTEPVGKHCVPCVPVVRKKRGKVAGVFRVRAVFRIKMRARVGKRVFLVAGAGASGMDMHCKNGIAALRPVDRQPGDVRDDERSAQRLVKRYGTLDRGVFFGAFYFSDSVRAVV